MKFYQCTKCRHIVISKDQECFSCCGEEMKELSPNVVDAAVEKHVPVVEQYDQSIIATVGEVIHPMEDAHYIEWILVEQKDGYQIHYFQPGELPKAEFTGSSFEAVYAYCNLHGLWKKELC